MKKLELIVPTELDDITVDQYSRYFTLVKGQENKEEISEFVRMNIVTIFCGVPMDFVREQMIYQDIIEISNLVLGLLYKLDAYVSAQPKPKPIIEHSGVEFGFMPEFDRMSGGEFADLSEYIKDLSNLNRIAAILYRPIEKKSFNKALNVLQYDVVEYNGTGEYANLMKHFPAKEALAAYFFVYSSYLILISHSLLFSKENQVAQ